MALYIGGLISSWVRENRVSSDGLTRLAEILELFTENDKGLYGRLVEVDGPLSNSIFSCDVMQPGREVTNTCFDKGQLYGSLDSVQRYLMGLGINVVGFISGGKKSPFPVVAHANAVPDLNAWYSPQSKDLTFGTAGDMSKGKDRWHLASDSDVSIHEFGHLILDHMNPMLGQSWRGDGRAIHEGFADSLAALYFDDPEMSEDFSVAMGHPPNKEAGLRTVNNDLTMDDVSSEEHDKGQVYGGYIWTLKKSLEDPNGPFKLPSREAADLMLKIIFNHASLYSTSKPSPKDFVNAMILAVDTLKSSGQLNVDDAALKSLMMSAADERKMLTSKAEEPEPDWDDWVTSFNDVGRRFGDIFRRDPIHVNEFIGGRQEIYQQQYVTKTGIVADVVGGLLNVKKDERGRIVFISMADVRELKKGEIDETININPTQARGLAAADAKKRLDEAQKWLQALWARRPNNFIELYRSYEMDARIAETALKKLGVKYFKEPDMKFVIIPGSNGLHYEIKVGLAIYYVDAKTGETILQKDVFIN